MQALFKYIKCIYIQQFQNNFVYYDFYIIINTKYIIICHHSYIIYIYLQAFTIMTEKSTYIQQKQHSREFQIIQSQSNDNSDQVCIEVLIQSDEEFSELSPQNYQMAIVLDEDQYYIILDKNKAYQTFNEVEWTQFFIKQTTFFFHKTLCVLNNEITKKGYLGNLLTLKQRNSILMLHRSDTSTRLKYWNIAAETNHIKHKTLHQESFQQDELSNQELYKNATEIMNETDLNQMKKNMCKLKRKLKNMISQRNYNCDSERLATNQKQIFKWIYKTVVNYTQIDPQVGYAKGIENVLLGIVIAYPEFNKKQLIKIFQYLMFVNNFRSIYLQGSPIFFSQLSLLLQNLQYQDNKLYIKLIDQHTDFKNIFVSYYKTFMIYKLSNTEAIRKIFDILLIYGIPFIKTMIVKILKRISNKIIKKQNLLEFLSSSIIRYYLQSDPQSEQNCNNISTKIQQLFIVQ